MIKYKCLVLDHDDTVVASEASVNYPCFQMMLDRFRPGETMELNEFTRWCFDPGFQSLLRDHYHFSDQEIDEEFQMWLQYSKSHIPPAYPGIKDIIIQQKEQGGLICVVSHSGRDNILRDYKEHFHIIPDAVFSWEDPDDQKKPSPYPLFEIMRRFQLTPQDLLVVDDLKPGYDMAKAAGVTFAYAGWGRSDVPEISRLMSKWSDYSLMSVSQLNDLIFYS